MKALNEPKKHVVPPEKTPHLSHSRINRYLQCPEQYRLYYIENLRPRFPSAGLVFGQLVHQALAALPTRPRRVAERRCRWSQGSPLLHGGN